MWKTLSVVLCIGLLAGCGQQSTEKDARVETVKSSVPQPPPNTDKRDLSMYAQHVTPILGRIKNDINNISELATMGGNDPYLLITAQYQNNVDSACSSLAINVSDMLDIDVPNNVKTQKLNQLMDDAMNDLNFIAVNFPVAVENQDANLMKDCTSHMESANNYFNQENDLLAQYNEENGVTN